MFTGLAYKEWLKLRFVFWVPLVVALGALLSVFISFRHVNEIIGPVMLWIDVAVADKVFYNDLKYLAVFTAVWFALFQFIPECSGKRLRLLFHLPVPRRQALYFMVAVGLGCTAAVCAIAAAGLVAISGHYLPFQAVKKILLTGAPWFLAGIPAYMGTVLVVVDPSRMHKLIHGCATLLFVNVLTSTTLQGAFEYSLPYYALACLLWLLPVEVGATRFKQGALW